ncbi:MAG: DUF1080 domain-containing protein [Pirellulales bacterium]
MGARTSSADTLGISAFIVASAAVCRVSHIVCVLVTNCLWCLSCAGAAERASWDELTAEQGLTRWRTEAANESWRIVGNVALNGTERKSLVARPGHGVIVSLHGDGADLMTKRSYGDIDVHLEFMIPKGSNSGVKLMGLYEIQIYDSHGVTTPSADDCGGIYPRAEQHPKYHLIDRGTAPQMNASKPAGEWQTLDIEFAAPRFNAHGQKLSNATFAKVVRNRHVIHEDVEVAYPTGKAWRLKREVRRGPLLLQGDHGPVAFRSVRVRDRMML